jgi:hypothetical protein
VSRPAAWVGPVAWIFGPDRRRPHPPRSRRPALVAVALLAGAAACVSPSRTDRDYQAKAVNTAESAASALATADLTVQAAERHRAPATYLSVLLSQAEQDLDGAQTSFDAVQPPSPAADRLRAEVGDLLTNAGDVLSALRIAARRGDLDSLPRIARPLPGLRQQLETVSDRYR